MNKEIDLGVGEIAVICEGTSEQAYLNLLLDNDKLIFNRDRLLDGKVLSNRYRTGKIFQSDYLVMNFDNPLTIILVQDDDTNLKLTKPYSEKVGEIIKTITCPEIEMLLVHHFDLFNEYNKQKSKMKPSQFIANTMGTKVSRIKSTAFIHKNLNADDLCDAIRAYSKKNRNKKINENYCLADLLKN